jgi:biotin transport system substrate-specific component
LALYAFGIPGLALMLDKTLSEAALMVAAFLPGDMLKVVLAGLVTHSLARMRPGILLSRG